MEERNFNGVQFEELRKEIDPKYNTVHDELSDCYYKNKPFREFGILTKEKFDKLHSLIFQIREVEFHKENLKQPIEKQYDEKKYNDITDKDGNVTGKKVDKANDKILELKNEGIELTIE